MAVTQADIDALNAALASGEKVVRIGDKSVEYRSPEEIIRARDNLQLQLNGTTTTAQRPRVIYPTQSGRGY